MPPKLIVTECPSKVKRVCRAVNDLTNGLVRILANLEPLGCVANLRIFIPKYQYKNYNIF